MAANDYLGVLTLVGQQKLAAAIGGTPLVLQTIRVGDGNGAEIAPNETMIDLVRRVGNAYGVVSSGRDPVNLQMWRVTAVIPEVDGPFNIREIGVFDADGDLMAIARHPLVEKRSPGQGAAVELTTDIVFPVSSTAQITVNFLPDVGVDIARLMRPPFIAVNSVTVASPPALPQQGDTYLVQPAPTGAWSGSVGKLAMWNGIVWSIAGAHVGTIIAASDTGKYWRRDASSWTEWNASTSRAGIVKLATNAETQAGTDAERAVTPESLSSRTASTTRTGLVELATNSEVHAGADTDRVTTPAGVSSAVQQGSWTYATAGGSANALTITRTPSPSVNVAGSAVQVMVTAANTGAATLKDGAAPALPIVRQGGTALVAGDLRSGAVVTLVCNGPAWQIVGASPSEAGRLIATKIITTSGTYTPTAGTTFIVVEGCGGGGAGAGGSNPSAGNISLGAPGGNASHGRAWFTAGQIGSSQSVTIGAGGTSAAGAAGTNGGSTSLGSLLVFPGGLGGQMFNNSSAPAFNGNGALAAAPTGANISYKQGSTPGYATALTALASGLFVGPGGDTPYGNGRANAPNSNGVAGAGNGSGGAGVALSSGGGPAYGGSGAPGILIIMEYGA